MRQEDSFEEVNVGEHKKEKVPLYDVKVQQQMSDEQLRII